LDYNFPHALEAQCGSWRDWVLGMRIALPDGRIVKTGSQAVKNVAGYDVHKLMIGARATLGVVLDVILRVFPVSALPKPELEIGPAGERCRIRGADRTSDEARRLPKWIQRTKPSDFAVSVRDVGDGLLAADHA